MSPICKQTAAIKKYTSRFGCAISSDRKVQPYQRCLGIKFKLGCQGK